MVLIPGRVYDAYLKMPDVLTAMLGYQWNQAAPLKPCIVSSFCLSLVGQVLLSMNHLHAPE